MNPHINVSNQAPDQLDNSGFEELEFTDVDEISAFPVETPFPIFNIEDAKLGDTIKIQSSNGVTLYCEIKLIDKD